MNSKSATAAGAHRALMKAARDQNRGAVATGPQRLHSTVGLNGVPQLQNTGLANRFLVLLLNISIRNLSRGAAARSLPLLGSYLVFNIQVESTGNLEWSSAFLSL